MFFPHRFGFAADQRLFRFQGAQRFLFFQFYSPLINRTIARIFDFRLHLIQSEIPEIFTSARMSRNFYSRSGLRLHLHSTILSFMAPTSYCLLCPLLKTFGLADVCLWVLLSGGLSRFLIPSSKKSEFRAVELVGRLFFHNSPPLPTLSVLTMHSLSHPATHGVRFPQPLFKRRMIVV